MSGKGTQSANLVEDFGFAHLSGVCVFCTLCPQKPHGDHMLIGTSGWGGWVFDIP